MAVPECSLCGQAIAVSDVTPSPKGAPPLKNPGFSSPIPEKQRSGSACSARGHITAFGLYCPLSGQAFAVALVQARFKRLDLVIFAIVFFRHLVVLLGHI